MARIKMSVNAKKRRRKVFKLAKGYFGAKSKQYRAATEQVARSLRYAYIGRRLRKRAPSRRGPSRSRGPVAFAGGHRKRL